MNDPLKPREDVSAALHALRAERSAVEADLSSRARGWRTIRTVLLLSMLGAVTWAVFVLNAPAPEPLPLVPHAPVAVAEPVAEPEPIEMVVEEEPEPIEIEIAPEPIEEAVSAPVSPQITRVTSARTRPRGNVRWADGARAFRAAEGRFGHGSRPMLVYFRTDWCGYCDAIDRALWADGEVARVVNQSYTAIRINPENSSDDEYIARGYRVRGYPAVFVKPSPSSQLLQLRPLRGGQPVSPDAFARLLQDSARRR